MTKSVAHLNRSDDWLYSPKHVKAGRELNALFHAIRVPDLPWPRNLFSMPYMFVPNAAPLELVKADCCQCGCGMKHNNGYPVTHTDRSSGIPVHHVLWFVSCGHHNQWLRRQGK